MAQAAVAERQVLIPPDKDANEIGRLYRLASGSLLDSMKHAIECGKSLAKKRDKMKHGEWLPWLEANSDALGFSARQTATRLIKLSAEGASTLHLDEATVVTVSRKLWGNKSRAPIAPDPAREIDVKVMPPPAKTELIDALSRVADFCEHNDPNIVAADMQPGEVAALQDHARVIDAWLTKFIGHL
jgi:Protein of unknown function (DUF3102)